MSSEIAARIAGYASALQGAEDSRTAFSEWSGLYHIDAYDLFETFDSGFADAPDPRGYVSVADAAALKGVSEQAVRDVLRNEKRRAAIFPGARYIGTKERGRWQLRLSEVEAWKPRRKAER